jgi:hypothetical protein
MVTDESVANRAMQTTDKTEPTFVWSVGCPRTFKPTGWDKKSRENPLPKQLIFFIEQQL